MNDLDRAITAAREALADADFNAYGVKVTYASALEDLLAALDAARGRAVAWQARLKIAGCERWTEWGEVGDVEQFKRFHAERGNACEVRAVYAAPPAAVPAMWSRGAVWAMWQCARRNNATIPDEELDAMRDALLAAARKGECHG